VPLTIVAFMIVIGLACFLGVSCSRNSSVAGAGTQRPVTRQNMRSLSREQIQEKLKRLEARKAPEPKMGAMCYDMAAPPDRAEYVCPKCGEKTLYSKDNARIVAWEIEACRREFSTLRGASDLSLTLDESSYCAHCSPSARKHQLALVVQYADGSSHTTAPISQGDMRILRDFLKGELSYETFNEGKQPLKNELPRLRELLGVGPEKEAVGK